MKRRVRLAGIAIVIIGAALLSIGVSITVTTHNPAVMRLWWVRAGPWLFATGIVAIIASAFRVGTSSHYDRRRDL